MSTDAVHWEGVGPIVASWVVTPFLSGLVAFGLFMSVQALIINTDNPFKNAKRFVPLYMFLTGFMVSVMTVTKGLKHVGLHLSTQEGIVLSIGVGALVMLLGIAILSRIKVDVEADKGFHYASVERVFAVLMIFTACSMAFAHGANDVANAVGPLAACASPCCTRSPPRWRSCRPCGCVALGRGLTSAAKGNADGRGADRRRKAALHAGAGGAVGDRRRGNGPHVAGLLVREFGVHPAG